MLNIYHHLVWATKNRFPYFDTPEIRKTVWDHIRLNSKKYGIQIDHINGYQDHCHCLVSVNPEHKISETVRLLKGESSRWINNRNLCSPKFEWQNDYYGVSVSPHDLPKVRNYIRSQENHHKHKTFYEEYEELMVEFGFMKF